MINAMPMYDHITELVKDNGPLSREAIVQDLITNYKFLSKNAVRETMKYLENHGFLVRIKDEKTGDQLFTFKGDITQNVEDHSENQNQEQPDQEPPQVDSDSATADPAI